MPNSNTNIPKRFYVEWWSIKKSTIYGLIFLVFLIVGVTGGGYLLWQNNFFLSSGQEINYPPDSARLTSYEGDVRIIRAATRQMEKVTANTYLVAGDILQTQADGRAQVEMADSSVLVVRPNSTVVIRANAGSGEGASVKVSLGGGQINVKTDEMAEATNNVVEVKQVENRLTARTEASFGINPSTNAGEIRVSRGTVESTTASGDKVLVKDEEYTSINENGKLSAKEKLLQAPKLLSPPALDKAVLGEVGAMDIPLRWQKTDGIPLSHYRVEVASSPFFVADGILLQQEPVSSPTLTLADVKAGTYFWRVRAVATTGQVGEWAEPWKFTVVTKLQGEKIEAGEWQVDKVGGNVYLISGRVNAGASVRIGGRETFASGDGSFRLQVSAANGSVDVSIGTENGKRSIYRLNLSTSKAAKIQ